MSLTQEQINDLADAVARAVASTFAKAAAKEKENDMLSTDEAAKYLGVSTSQLYKMTSQRRIRYYKPTGKLVYFKRDDLDRWMRSNPVASMEDIEEEAQQYIAQHPNPVTKR